MEAKRNPVSVGGSTGHSLIGAQSISLTDAIAEFSDAMRSAGLEPPPEIIPGVLHRFAGVGKKPSNRSGWCKLFEDTQGGVYGCWATGVSGTWQARRAQSLSLAERAEFKRRVDSARKQAQATREAKQHKAAVKARWIWDNAAAVAGHPYLAKKRIPEHLYRPTHARTYKGALTLPVKDFSGALVNLQFIDTDGGKNFLGGARKKGCVIPVATFKDATTVIVCEGWATGCTLAEDSPDATVLTAIDAGNLEPVALAVRRRWPNRELIIAGDDDRLTPGNPGATAARNAAINAGAQLVLPQWPDGAPESLSDFNDLVCWRKGGAV